jgi:hypothetical protein
MIARGKFRHHPAIQPVQIDLAEQLVRQQAALVVEHRHGAFVTG